MIKKYTYFNQSDFDKCSPKCSIHDMDEDFMQRLDECRKVAGIPFVLTSAYRSAEHDRSKGRSGTGAHTTGKAVDVRAVNSRSRFRIIAAAIQCGFTRIGIHKSFIHLDTSESHAQEVLWLY